ncbi:hypothetical protein Ccrd_001464 [Cynara cardunculus var. scolymus]|uniref:Uncharacterized protein n=1 Tax=Cynara cardunculus var. scolymus TaxID=59895 RepID=A0A103XTA5_CYNCS|nr:hypothetical protein Ccrd_001464 [Cynara cardunculus var. scolymus]
MVSYAKETHAYRWKISTLAAARLLHSSSPSLRCSIFAEDEDELLLLLFGVEGVLLPLLFGDVELIDADVSRKATNGGYVQ